MNRQAFLAAALAAIGLEMAGPFALAQSAQPAPPAGRQRRVGILALVGPDDPTMRAILATWHDRLRQLGWTGDREVQVEVRVTGDDPRKAAAQLLETAPDAVVVQGRPGIEAMRHVTRTLPTVFVQVSDPVAAGYVSSLERPGGNVTGVANFPASIAGDRVRLLKEIAPQVSRVVLVHDRHYPTPAPMLTATQAAARALGLELHGTGAGDAEELERLLGEAARGAPAGLVILPSPFTHAQAERIVRLAAQLGLPAVYPLPNFAEIGGLVAYGVDTPAMWREAAAMIDRILRGADPAGLPVHVPGSVHIVANAKAAKALGIALPPALLARAAQVID